MTAKFNMLLVVFLFLYILNFATEKEKPFRFVFYNVENLFYPTNDSLTLDDEFTPDGERYWNFSRYNNKLVRLGKVIVACGEGIAPDLVGICEIENRRVLDELVNKTFLKAFKYRIIHKESPDKRGIDVALLYRESSFFPLSYTLHKVGGEHWCSREILEVCGVANNEDTINVFVNHWPSRYGGELESRSRRLAAAKVLASAIDSVRLKWPDRMMIVTGDFNDGPIDESIASLIKNCRLKNLSSGWKKGTIKHQGQWGIFDQFIVSKNMKGSAEIYSAPYLLEADDRFLGERPRRTYIGYHYNGGFSDHLPVVAELYF